MLKAKMLKLHGHLTEYIGAYLVLGVIAYSLFFSQSLPVGYIGRDGQYDVWCGYKPVGFGDTEYDCEWEPAAYLNRK